MFGGQSRQTKRYDPLADTNLVQFFGKTGVRRQLESSAQQARLERAPPSYRRLLESYVGPEQQNVQNGGSDLFTCMKRSRNSRRCGECLNCLFYFRRREILGGSSALREDPINDVLSMTTKHSPARPLSAGPTRARRPQSAIGMRREDSKNYTRSSSRPLSATIRSTASLEMSRKSRPQSANSSKGTSRRHFISPTRRREHTVEKASSPPRVAELHVYHHHDYLQGDSTGTKGGRGPVRGLSPQKLEAIAELIHNSNVNSPTVGLSSSQPSSASIAARPPTRSPPGRRGRQHIQRGGGVGQSAEYLSLLEMTDRWAQSCYQPPELEESLNKSLEDLKSPDEESRQLSINDKFLRQSAEHHRARAAIVIQSFFRGFSDRQKTASRHASARLVQKHWRSFLKRKRGRHAALRLQRIGRGLRARRAFYSLAGRIVLTRWEGAARNNTECSAIDAHDAMLSFTATLLQIFCNERDHRIFLLRLREDSLWRLHQFEWAKRERVIRRHIAADFRHHVKQTLRLQFDHEANLLRQSSVLMLSHREGSRIIGLSHDVFLTSLRTLLASLRVADEQEPRERNSIQSTEAISRESLLIWHFNTRSALKASQSAEELSLKALQNRLQEESSAQPTVELRCEPAVIQVSAPVTIETTIDDTAFAQEINGICGGDEDESSEREPSEASVSSRASLPEEGNGNTSQHERLQHMSHTVNTPSPIKNVENFEELPTSVSETAMPACESLALASAEPVGVQENAFCVAATDEGVNKSHSPEGNTVQVDTPIRVSHTNSAESLTAPHEEPVIADDSADVLAPETCTVVPVTEPEATTKVIISEESILDAAQEDVSQNESCVPNVVEVAAENAIPVVQERVAAQTHTTAHETSEESAEIHDNAPEIATPPIAERAQTEAGTIAERILLSWGVSIPVPSDERPSGADESGDVPAGDAVPAVLQDSVIVEPHEDIVDQPSTSANEQRFVCEEPVGLREDEICEASAPVPESKELSTHGPVRIAADHATTAGLVEEPIVAEEAAATVGVEVVLPVHGSDVVHDAVEMSPAAAAGIPAMGIIAPARVEANADHFVQKEEVTAKGAYKREEPEGSVDATAARVDVVAALVQEVIAEVLGARGGENTPKPKASSPAGEGDEHGVMDSPEPSATVRKEPLMNVAASVPDSPVANTSDYIFEVAPPVATETMDF